MNRILNKCYCDNCKKAQEVLKNDRGCLFCGYEEIDKEETKRLDELLEVAND